MTDRELMQQSLDALEGNDLGLHYRTIDALRAALAQPAPAVPDGWVMVPREPTPEMIARGWNASRDKQAGEAVRIGYRAMIAAAPESAPAAPAVREPLHAWEFVAMWATAAEKHGNTYDAAVEFGCAVEARCAAAPAVREPLTREAVDAIWNRLGSFTDRQLDWIRFARAIEQARGIGGGK